MIHAPLRGLFFLGRAAFIVAAAAAVPYVIKRNKRVADQIGESLIKAGESMKKASQEADSAAKATAGKPVAEPAKARTTAKAKPAVKKTVAKKPAAKKPAPRKKPTPPASES